MGRLKPATPSQGCKPYGDLMQDLLDKLARAFYRTAFLACRLLWYLSRPTTRGVLVAIWHADRLLVVKPSYKSGYALPGGFVKRGEEEVAAAVRELAEEIRLQVDPGQLCFWGRSRAVVDFKDDRVVFFEIELADQPAIRIDRREIVWAQFLSAGDALQLELSPHVRGYLLRRGQPDSKPQC
jgi:ADP-ribose pyrophosphatase YjhB (NUDIX family)